MRWLRLLSVLGLVVAACGGSAKYDANGSPNLAGAAGRAGDDAGASSDGPPGVGGTAGGAPTSGAGIGGDGGMGIQSGGAGGEAGTGNAGASAAAGTAGAGGQVLPDCQGLDCLAGAELVYWPDREWHGAKANPSTNELLEADYEPKMAPAWDVKFSNDARQVVLTPRAGGSAVQGTRNLQHADRAWFDLMLSIGGRFVVQVGTAQFQAEYTAYGSGVPIVSSTRGALQAP